VTFKVGASFNALKRDNQRLTAAVEFQHPATTSSGPTSVVSTP